MPAKSRETLLCRYHYDPLDRLVGCALSAEDDTLRFYRNESLTTEVRGAIQTSVIHYDDYLLAQQRSSATKRDTVLLATDLQRSAMSVIDTTGPHFLAFTPYGHRPAESGLLSLLGFNGERPEPLTGHYLLGNGYRAFNPVFMRFNSPDSWSPFGEGGVNAYAYCEGNPVNTMDKTGHAKNLIKGILNIFGRRPKKVKEQLAILKKQINEYPEVLKSKKEITQDLGEKNAKIANQMHGVSVEALAPGKQADIKIPPPPDMGYLLPEAPQKSNMSELTSLRTAASQALYNHETFIHNYHSNLAKMKKQRIYLKRTNKPLPEVRDFIRNP